METREPGASQGGGRLSVAALLLLGLLLFGVSLYWNRIALGGPLGQAPEWVRTLALPISAVVETAFGPIELDPPGSSQPARVSQLVTSWTIAAALYFAAVWGVLARGWGRPKLARDVILAFAILFRIVLIFSPPLLETDPKRYLWDGAVLANGVNPYKFAPLEILLHARGELEFGDPVTTAEAGLLATLAAEPRLTPQFLHINHPNVATVYPPVAQGLFAVAYRLAPGEVMALKTLVALVDLGILALVAHLLGVLGRPPEWLLIYGWCPLVLKEYAGTGHYDPAAGLFLLGSLAVLLRGYRAAAGMLAGLAIGAKFFPGVVVLVLLRRYGLRGAVACALTVLALYAPFLGAADRIAQSAGVFAAQWTGNASLFALLRGALRPLDAAGWRLPFGPEAGLALDSMLAAKALMGLALLAGLAALFRAAEEDAAGVLSKAFGAVGLLFILSPVQNPWYAGWVMPYAALSGSVAWVVLSGTMVTYYAYFSAFDYLRALPGGWALDLRWLEYLPFYGLLSAELRRARRGAQGPALAGPELLRTR
jgi:hypothetical protein